MLTADEVADLTRLGRKAVYELGKRGELPGYRRIGTKVRFCRATLLRWIGQEHVVPARKRGR